jgi:hypothetical protein
MIVRNEVNPVNTLRITRDEGKKVEKRNGKRTIWPICSGRTFEFNLDALDFGWLDELESEKATKERWWVFCPSSPPSPGS